MQIKLTRIQLDNDVTIGELVVNKFTCWTCEDAVRPQKIAGQTAIPAGRYRVRTTFSNRFKRLLPLLDDVPGFTGVRIHPGNTAADTEGCILPGLVRMPKGVGQSRDAFASIFDMILAAEQAGEKIWIEIQ